jgi:hypothetical protein
MEGRHAIAPSLELSVSKTWPYGEQRANTPRYNFLVARCRVSFTDSEKLEHSAEVEAESLYEAVALAVADFRDDPLLPDHPGDQTEFTVAVLRNPTKHKIRLSQVVKWAEPTMREGPAGVSKTASPPMCSKRPSEGMRA